MARILVISPHPDDEVLGCGGSVCSHVGAGDLVHVAFLTSGEHGGRGEPADETARLREAEARAAASELGIGDVMFWREPDGSLETSPELVARLRDLAGHLRPDIIYVPHAGEDHPDHRAANRLVGLALASQPPLRILQYEVWTPLQAYDCVVDISEHFKRKLRAIRRYESQCALRDYPQGFRGLARYRAALHGAPGCRYAEVFARMPPASDFRLPTSDFLSNTHSGAS